MDTGSFFTAIGFEEISLDAVKGVTTKVGDVDVYKVFISVETQAIRYCYDGTTPTASKGHPVAAGGSFTVYGFENVANLRMISQTGTAVLDVTLEAL